MTQNQTALINKLLAEKNFSQLDADFLADNIELMSGKTVGCTIDLENLKNLDSKTASKLISALLNTDSKAFAAKRTEYKTASMDKHDKLVEWAKENGIKASKNMKSATVREKILDAGLQVPAEFAGKIADKTVGKW